MGKEKEGRPTVEWWQMLYSVYRIDKNKFGETGKIRMVNQLSGGAKTSINTEWPGCQNYLLVLSMNKTFAKSWTHTDIHRHKGRGRQKGGKFCGPTDWPMKVLKVLFISVLKVPVCKKVVSFPTRQTLALWDWGRHDPQSQRRSIWQVEKWDNFLTNWTF